ncbi:MAG: M23 family metallopeptidase [Alphaproteobacteria bacterium]|nr:M23 family metallopeptidase [Alphaproteobacteria bacterium]
MSLEKSTRRGWGAVSRVLQISPTGNDEAPSSEASESAHQSDTLSARQEPDPPRRQSPWAEHFARLRKATTGLVPERQVFFRTRGEIRYVTIPGWLQIATISGAAALVGWGGFTTGYYFSFDRVMAFKDQQIHDARSAHQAVAQEVGRYEQRFVEYGRDLKERREALAQVISQVDSADALKLGGVKAEELPVFFGVQDVRSPEMRALHSPWGRMGPRKNELWLNFDHMESELKTVVANHAGVVDERDRLRERLQDLEGTVTSLRSSHEQVLRRVTESTNDTVVEVEKLIGMTGLKVSKLLDRLKAREPAMADRGLGGQGGPFVEVASLSLPPDDPIIRTAVMLDRKMERWNNLQRLLRMLPLVPPVDHYRLTSSFGRRIDPLRRRWAHHHGVDLANYSGTPILAAAPGRVVFSGWRGNYGRTIEIDHGLGVQTRYSHLKKILVKEGQRVEFRDKIALMGSSGRSTGTHLHYEVRFDEKPLNPIKFMKAGKYVFKGK